MPEGEPDHASKGVTPERGPRIPRMIQHREDVSRAIAAGAAGRIMWFARAAMTARIDQQDGEMRRERVDVSSVPPTLPGSGEAVIHQQRRTRALDIVVRLEISVARDRHEMLLLRPDGMGLTERAREAFDGVSELGEGGFTIGRIALHHAAADVILENQQPRGPRACDHGRQLREDVETVGVLVDHPLDAANLPLEPAQAIANPGAVRFVGWWAVVGGSIHHEWMIPLWGISGQMPRHRA